MPAGLQGGQESAGRALLMGLLVQALGAGQPVELQQDAVPAGAGIAQSWVQRRVGAG